MHPHIVLHPCRWLARWIRAHNRDEMGHPSRQMEQKHTRSTDRKFFRNTVRVTTGGAFEI